MEAENAKTSNVCRLECGFILAHLGAVTVHSKAKEDVIQTTLGGVLTLALAQRLADEDLTNQCRSRGAGSCIFVHCCFRKVFFVI